MWVLRYEVPCHPGARGSGSSPPVNPDGVTSRYGRRNQGVGDVACEVEVSDMLVLGCLCCQIQPGISGPPADTNILCRRSCRQVQRMEGEACEAVVLDMLVSECLCWGVRGVVVVGRQRE